MISQYPDFTKLDISQRSLISDFVGQFEPYSDFNFTSIFSWNTNDSTELAWLNGNLVIRLPDYLSGESVTSMLGTNTVDLSLQTLLKDCPNLTLIPEITVQNMADPNTFLITEERENFDYIYNVTNLSLLAGQDFKKKRNKISSFVKAHQHTLTSEYADSISPAAHTELLKLFDKWAAQHKQAGVAVAGYDTDDTALERQAMTILLDNAADLNLAIFLLRNEGELVAFSINEILTEDYAICHFEKALLIHPQINSYVGWQAAKTLGEHGCKYVNWEQDLGIAGLRRSKESFQPDRFLKKYSVSLNNSASN